MVLKIPGEHPLCNFLSTVSMPIFLPTTPTCIHFHSGFCLSCYLFVVKMPSCGWPPINIINAQNTTKTCPRWASISLCQRPVKLPHCSRCTKGKKNSNKNTKSSKKSSRLDDVVDWDCTPVPHPLFENQFAFIPGPKTGLYPGLAFALFCLCLKAKFIVKVAQRLQQTFVIRQKSCKLWRSWEFFFLPSFFFFCVATPSVKTRPGDTSQEIAFVFPLFSCFFFRRGPWVTEWLFGGLPQLPFCQLDGWFRISDAASIKTALEIHRFLVVLSVLFIPSLVLGRRKSCRKKKCQHISSLTAGSGSIPYHFPLHLANDVSLSVHWSWTWVGYMIEGVPSVD